MTNWKLVSNPGQSSAPNWEDGLKRTNDGVGGQQWTIVARGCKPKLTQTIPIYTNNSFKILSTKNDPDTNTTQQQTTPVPQPNATKDTKKRRRDKIQKYRQDTLKQLKDNDELFFNKCITQAEDERMMIAKQNKTNAQRLAIEDAHNYQSKLTVRMWRYGCNITNKINQLSIGH